MSEKKPEPKLKYFEDADCQKPISVIEFPEPPIRGETKGELVIYAKNMTKDELDNLHFDPKDKDLHIEPSATSISGDGMITLKLTFEPTKAREIALDTEFVVTGRRIIRSVQKA